MGNSAGLQLSKALRHGDAANAILTAGGHNLRRILARLRALCAIMTALITVLWPQLDQLQVLLLNRRGR
jgi:hypothetical protein